MSTETEPLDLAACRAEIERAHTEVGNIAHDGRDRWRMSVPAQPDRDSDLILSAGLSCGERLADEIEYLLAERDALKAAETEWRDAQTGLIREREDAIRRAVAAENREDAVMAGLEQTTAELGALKAAIAEVRRLQEMTIASSCRMHAIEQAEDTLAVLDRTLAVPESTESTEEETDGD